MYILRGKFPKASGKRLNELEFAYLYGDAYSESIVEDVSPWNSTVRSVETHSVRSIVNSYPAVRLPKFFNSKLPDLTAIGGGMN